MVGVGESALGHSPSQVEVLIIGLNWKYDNYIGEARLQEVRKNETSDFCRYLS
jgi:hypothetical protein